MMGRVLFSIFLILSMGSTSVLPAGKTGFKPALPGWRYEFPRDHRVHREFKTEWWYYNGTLKSPEGQEFGYQVTFFRIGLVPGPLPEEGSRWRLHEVYMAHIAVSDIDKKSFLFQEKAGRANLGLAGADEGRYHIWVGKWQVIEKGKEHRITAGDGDLSLSLGIVPTRPPLIHGIGGVSQKGNEPGQASHYYSITRMETKGHLIIKGKRFPVTGISWMDHEFGSNQIRENQIGWDWFSLQLTNGMDLMIYQLRQADGTVDPNSSGTLSDPGAGKIHLSRSEINIRVFTFWKSSRSGATYPASWEIYLPRYDLRLKLYPLIAEQELITPTSTRVTYWEGVVQVKGRCKGRIVEGKGYVEMTGYDRRFPPKI